MVGSIVSRTLLVAGLVLGTVLAGGPAGATTEPTSAGTAPLPSPVPASGTFDAIIDPGSFTFRDRLGGCELTVNGTLVFSGTLTGDAVGTTTALVFAPCSQVATQPPGAYADIFRFVGTFTGAVAGDPVTTTLTYAGVTHVGGAIDAAIVAGGDVPVAARAEAIVATGGSYTGLALA
jgi:hypothetical protein